MKVVLPFDGSESANRALEYVVGLAGRIDGRALAVDLVNVQNATVGLPGLFSRNAAEVSEKLTQTVLAEGARLLEAARAKLEQAEIRVKSSVLVGEPAQEIAAFADNQNAGAIVMGTRGLGAVGGLVMGSVAAKVVHLVKVPVTLVK